MRQAGVLAAAGLIALEEMPARLAADHANARRLAEGLAGIPGVRVAPERVRTNIVIFDIEDTGRTPAWLSAVLKERGVLMNGVSATAMRAVTHGDVSAEACEEALGVVRGVLGE